MMMALRYFFPGRKFTFAEINKKMRHRKGKYTFPAQIAVVLKDYGLKVCAFASKDISTNVKDLIKGFKSAFGKDYDVLVKNINFKTDIYFTKRAKKEKIFKVRKNSLDELEGYFKKGCVIMPCIDINVLLNKKGPFEGHFVIITNMDKNSVWINDSNAGCNIKYSRKLFNKAYTVQAIDDDVLVIYGKQTKNGK